MGNSYPPIGRSGGSLTDIQEETLKHFKYNAITERLKADRSIETTLDSLYLGGQHKISGAGEGIVNSSLYTGIHWLITAQGLKPQEDPANRGPEGMIPPHGRKYGDNLLDYEAQGPETSGPIVYSTHIRTPEAPASTNYSLWGFTIRTEFAIPAGHTFTYRARRDDLNGLIVFDQRHKVLVDIPAGGLYDFWLTHMFDVAKGSIIQSQIHLDDGTHDRNPVTLSMSINTVDGDYWAKVKLRTYEDKDIPFTEDVKDLTNIKIGETEWVLGELLTNSIHWTDGQVICWPSTAPGAAALGDYINWADSTFP